MKPVLYYLLQMIVASGILYAYYHLALRNKKFHRYNRFYLLSAVVISILIPFLNIPVYFSAEETHSSFVLQTLTTISSPAVNDPILTSSPIETVKHIWLTLENLSYSLYFFIAAIALLRIFFSIRKINTIIKNNPVENLQNICFVNTDEPGTPFSFFKWLFWNRKIDLQSAKGEQVFRHELFHIQQKHSWDILFMEIITVGLWINPFFHLMKKELKAIHEFLADEFAVHETKKWEYAELLLMQAMNTQIHLTNPFFHNQIKRRIAMITSSSKPSYQYLRKLLVLPIAAILVALFAFKYKNKEADSTIRSEKQITAVIDAGHGGNDPGVKSLNGNYTEAQLNLEISKMIQQLAGEYNINVVMTRENENFPGNAKNKEEGLRQRLNLANKTAPDAFIAIHMNKTNRNILQRKFSGIEAYIIDKKDNSYEQLLASTVLQELSTIYKTDVVIKQRKKQGIYILDQNDYPSMLIECGYMDNPDDLNFITDKTNQEKIAKAILQALVKYANNSKTFEPSKNIIGNDTVPNAKGVYEKAEVEPSFLGGDQAWRRYLEKTLQGFDPAKNGASKGNYTVFIQFVVDENGNISDVIPLTKHGYGMEEQVLRIIKKGPKWIPAMQNGKNVKAYKKQPVTFQVAVDGKSTSIQSEKINKITLADTSHPLIVIDGKQQPGLKISQLDQKVSVNAIESISVLKGTNAIQKYGPKGKDGVIEINTKQNKNIQIKEVTLADKNSDDNKIFEKVEVEPSFPGGDVAWRRYLQKNLQSFNPADSGAKAGNYTVYIQFIVDENGNISDIKPLTNHGYGMEEGAMKLIAKGPKWVPAIQNGHNVKAYKKQPVTFQIQEE